MNRLHTFFALPLLASLFLSGCSEDFFSENEAVSLPDFATLRFPFNLALKPSSSPAVLNLTGDCEQLIRRLDGETQGTMSVYNLELKCFDYGQVSEYFLTENQQLKAIHQLKHSVDVRNDASVIHWHIETLITWQDEQPVLYFREKQVPMELAYTYPIQLHSEFQEYAITAELLDSFLAEFDRIAQTHAGF